MSNLIPMSIVNPSKVNGKRKLHYAKELFQENNNQLQKLDLQNYP